MLEFTMAYGQELIALTESQQLRRIAADLTRQADDLELQSDEASNQAQKEAQQIDGRVSPFAETVEQTLAFKRGMMASVEAKQLLRIAADLTRQADDLELQAKEAGDRQAA